MHTVGMIVRKQHRKCYSSNLKASAYDIQWKDIENVEFTNIFANILYQNEACVRDEVYLMKYLLK